MITIHLYSQVLYPGKSPIQYTKDNLYIVAPRMSDDYSLVGLDLYFT